MLLSVCHLSRRSIGKRIPDGILEYTSHRDPNHLPSNSTQREGRGVGGAGGGRGATSPEVGQDGRGATSLEGPGVVQSCCLMEFMLC